ncbi:Y-family DNA polymerase [Sphingosinithalassobacter sp. CS137]|uniref:Y-family DNA polymerase n=1 Tax=Sphingosinithalassobacter sp. CS137 TaxID=2762748 RepID=UPI00165DCE8F|nr:DNA polymerase Y family protein [Sphingosinithalassobacter sp. CS137]
MKRVAALYLPNWPIDRLRQAERTAAPPERRGTVDAAPLAAAAATERLNACSVPREAGFRPGARWARAERAKEIDALPAHQRPRMRELGRRSEAAEHPFKAAHAENGRGGAHPPVSPLRKATLPLVTSHRVGTRTLVATACPAARALGIVPGMALTSARAQLPGLEVHPADPQGDAEALRRLAVLAARRWSPLVARAGEHGLFLDLTGVAHLFGGEEAMARRILRLLTRRGYAARIAVADTAGAAWALVTRMPEPVLLCPPGAHRTAIAALPPEALRIASTAVELLRRLGVDRIGTLAAMPRAPLVRRFGRGLAERLDQALGLAPEPLDPIIPQEHILAGHRFAEPVLSAEGIAFWLGQLVPELANALAQAGLGARRIEFVAERIDGVPQRIRIGLARASRDPAHLVRLLARRIEEIEPGFGIDSITLHVRRAEPLGPSSFSDRLDAEDSVPDLAPLVDTLATRIGAAHMWRMRAVESDVPERSAAHGPVLDPPAPPVERRRIDDVRQLDTGAALPPWHARWPRPTRLLHRPEQVDDVLALLPDQPPRRFTWRGETHRIVRADGPERIHGEWWKRLSEVHATRDYYRVEDEQGRRYWLFRRGDGERAVSGDMRWYLHGVFG